MRQARLILFWGVLLIARSGSGQHCDTTFVPPVDKARLGEVHYGPLIGGTAGQAGTYFEADVLGEGDRLARFQVNLSDASRLIHAFRFDVEDAAGRVRTFTCGRPLGTWAPAYEVSEGATWEGLSAAAGWYVDSIQLHFSGEHATPTYGGQGGDLDVHLSLRGEGAGYRNEMRGLWGTFHEGLLETVGLVFWPEEDAAHVQVFDEAGGLVAGEAEHFSEQRLSEVRRWVVHTMSSQATGKQDGDPTHAATASGGAYLESLPDTRRTHDDPLIPGENFSNEPGRIGVLVYPVRFSAPGRYYVWVRAYSTGTEDNGLHVGLGDTWPASGQRMQWCEDKNAWTWASKQRTEENHCGVPGQIYLDVEAPGVYDLTFSLREDGFEFDKWILTTDPSYVPDGLGPEARRVYLEGGTRGRE